MWKPRSTRTAQGLVEYALVVALIAVVCIASLESVRNAIWSRYQQLLAILISASS